ncbi:hypothetical protein F2P81_024065 [Scophthalmus maximus]|uniref:Uncharacterized protein n=1 Tax=Scophthalmus maximus TaxID=52904 RepID=A0A6A4RTC1_SCOMX|nr:hypothetical protein F2P81_024065 [Scophthalmus maximus]
MDLNIPDMCDPFFAINHAIAQIEANQHEQPDNQMNPSNEPTNANNIVDVRPLDFFEDLNNASNNLQNQQDNEALTIGKSMQNSAGMCDDTAVTLSDILFLFLHENHYYGIISAKAFLGCKNVCNYCYEDLNNSISDEELDRIVSDIHHQYPSAGYKIILGHLRSRQLFVKKERVLESLRRLDPEGVVMRRLSLRTIRRRCYSVPAPNSVWHIDGHHKLIL